MRLRIIAPDGARSELVVAAAVARLGRDPACEVHFDAAVYPKVSAEHAKIERTAGGLVLTHLSGRNKTLVNDRPIEGAVPVQVGDRIRLGYTGPTVEILAADAPIASPPPRFETTVEAGEEHMALLRGTAVAAERFEIGAGGVIGREQGKARFLLQHPLVSRLHASLAVDGDRVVLTDLGSANGTYVNGHRLTRSALLQRGDRIDIGPFSLVFDGEALVSQSRSNNIELVARGLQRVVKDRATGGPLTLLDDISLVFRPREFVCLLGPSGSGKSTLLALLSGRNPPDEGAVTVNGQDLYANFAALKQDIAVVPQKDVLHESLAVDAALRFTAELRLPPDTQRDEITASVADILDVVGLTKRGQTLIRHLSGGQVKRASLANEILCKPTLLFLDEVTSGLDEQTDRDMMELFRQVADDGKTVVCITHSLANVEATCHLVVILTEGGRLAFVGTPAEAKPYFGVERLGEVYQRLAERDPAQWQAAFASSSLHARYVRDRLPADIGPEDEVAEAAWSAGRHAVNPFRQAWILLRRYLAVWRGDVPALLAMLGQSLLVALLLGLVFGDLSVASNPVERLPRTLNLLFLLNVSCFWFGCNNAAKELVKERVIYTRERDFNLRIDSYYASKFLVLTLIALIQVTLLLGIVRPWCLLPGEVGLQLVTLVVLALAGTALGLLISALARTEEVAVALVPVVVMPQIILAGVIAPLKGLSQVLAKGLMTANWGERALESLLPEEDRKLLQLEDPEYNKQLLVIAAHVLVAAGATLITLWFQGRSRTRR
jgi:ABC-type multidrug transport system ATPase subunit/pSer/pThr/pTyr-binding forkhead associated (FHA) protein